MPTAYARAPAARRCCDRDRLIFTGNHTIAMGENPAIRDTHPEPPRVAPAVPGVEHSFHATTPTGSLAINAPAE